MKLALPFLRRAAENAGPEHVGPQVAYAAARSALDASRGEQKQGVSSAARSRHSSAQEPTREGGSPLEASATLPPSLAVKPNIPWEKQTVEQLEAERDYWAQQVAAAPGWASANAADGFRRACDSWLTRRRRNPVSSAEPAADRGPGLNPDPVPQ
jgi:hypothetical protein